MAALIMSGASSPSAHHHYQRSHALKDALRQGQHEKSLVYITLRKSKASFQGMGGPLGRWFSGTFPVCACTQSVLDLTSVQIKSVYAGSWARACSSASLLYSQVTLGMLICRPHFE